MLNTLLYRLVVALLILVSANVAIAQSTTYQPKGSFSVDVGIPTSEKNQAFGDILEGLFNGGVGYQYNIYEGLTVGVGGRFSFFTNDRFALKATVGKGGLYVPGVYGKLGFEKFTTDRFSFNFSVRAGYVSFISVNDSSKVKLGKPFVESSFFIEPQLELLLTAEKNDPNGFSLVFGYPIYFAEYTPKYLSIDSFVGLLPEDSMGKTRFFSLGFGYRYYFGMN